MVQSMSNKSIESTRVVIRHFQTEAPILVRPFIKDMTKSELHAMMTGGFATIAGGVLAAYIMFGVSARFFCRLLRTSPCEFRTCKSRKKSAVTSGKIRSKNSGPKFILLRPKLFAKHLISRREGLYSSDLIFDK